LRFRRIATGGFEECVEGRFGEEELKRREEYTLYECYFSLRVGGWGA